VKVNCAGSCWNGVVRTGRADWKLFGAKAAYFQLRQVALNHWKGIPFPEHASTLTLT
jgi:hypothetical protein